tara:strand:- start:3447 stop:3653 length:207 start_codon:yes stop_codon:yes gene_type:complete
MDEKLVHIIDIENIWRKTFMCRIFKKKTPDEAWIKQLVRIKNRQYKKKYNINKAYRFENRQIIFNIYM